MKTQSLKGVIQLLKCMAPLERCLTWNSESNFDEEVHYQPIKLLLPGREFENLQQVYEWYTKCYKDMGLPALGDFDLINVLSQVDGHDHVTMSRPHIYVTLPTYHKCDWLKHLYPNQEKFVPQYVDGVLIGLTRPVKFIPID